MGRVRTGVDRCDREGLQLLRDNKARQIGPLFVYRDVCTLRGSMPEMARSKLIVNLVVGVT